MIYYKRALWMKTLCNMSSYLHFLLYCYHSRHVGVYYNCFNECVMSVSILSVRWRVVSECGSCWQFRSRSLPEVCYEIIDKSFHCDLSVKYDSSYTSLRENELCDIGVKLLLWTNSLKTLKCTEILLYFLSMKQFPQFWYQLMVA